jgi:cation diffusion facilitator CzcD-associated flavoprotein CzcO
MTANGVALGADQPSAAGPFAAAQTSEASDDATHADVIIVGAGLSGIGAAYHLQRHCPQKSFVLLEARDSLGGTWDLFRYPGVRSDSDMHTLGYRFRPWRGEKAIADGPSILTYLQDTAQTYGIDRKIRFKHRVLRAAWSSADALWTLDVQLPDGATQRMTCHFLQMCSGYYDYHSGYMPGWVGMERFTGEIVHPQAWPKDFNYDGKRVIVIGSGATAVTLVPAMAEQAAHVTMLQRSPTYIVSRPSRDAIANWLYRTLPEGVAHTLARWKNIALQMYFYGAARRKPDAARKMILKLAQAELGPDVDVERHFNPRYNPWDQRLCLIPDGDLFASIRAGTSSVVTGEIESFTERGVKLRSGEELAADIIVTATGLNMKLLGGVTLSVDGKPISLSETMNYKGMMFSELPNFALTFGYTNASWTLKSDLTAEYLCRLLNYMDANGFEICTPRNRDASISADAALPLNSGYVERARDLLPKQGTKTPWKLRQNYVRDMLALRFGDIDDGAMAFTRRSTQATSAVQTKRA